MAWFHKFKPWVYLIESFKKMFKDIFPQKPVEKDEVDEIKDEIECLSKKKHKKKKHR